ncbi:hypothetical protein HD806DRAFT_161020 [Xylariaceae sp. AK1471]|nr:hypothetical protein HD806DRAFT_161020 [Xylariaceae sp. AK1471]
MSDPFSLAAGTLGIGSALIACMDGISKVQIARRSEADFETCQLRLTWLKLRLSRWGEAVRIHEDPRFNTAGPTSKEVRLAKNTIFLILDKLTTYRELSKGLQRSSDPNEDTSVFENRDLPADFLALDSGIQSIIAQRQKNKLSRTRVLSWVLYSREHVLDLIRDISTFIDELERHFPSPQQEEALVRSELEKLAEVTTHQQCAFEKMQERVQDIDKTLSKVREPVATSHRIHHQTITDNARVQFGHTITKAWAHSPGPLPIAAGMIVDVQSVGGSSRVREGDVYAEKDEFWE